jgi:hypothetical protein
MGKESSRAADSSVWRAALTLRRGAREVAKKGEMGKRKEIDDTHAIVVCCR